MKGLLSVLLFAVACCAQTPSALESDPSGWKDLLAARSNVLDNIAEFSTRAYPEPCSIFRNLGKMMFEDVTAQAGPDMQTAAAHRGAAIGDLDNDGKPDVVLTVLMGKARVLHNISANQNNWVQFRLVGTKSNRSAIGAQLKLTTGDGAVQYDILSPRAGSGASKDPRVHFGLGAFKTVKQLDIRWPSGTRQVLKDLPGGRLHRIEEP